MISQRAALERMNYYSDPRVISAMTDSCFSVKQIGRHHVLVEFDEYIWETLQSEDLVPEEDDSMQLELPGKWAICHQCEGSGRMVNPSIDCGGITQDEWYDWDEDDREGYFSGRYDVSCSVAGCQDGKVFSPVFPPLIAQEIEDREREAADDARQRAMELRYGC